MKIYLDNEPPPEPASLRTDMEAGKIGRRVRFGRDLGIVDGFPKSGKWTLVSVTLTRGGHVTAPPESFTLA